MAGYRFTKEAIKDLDEIWSYTKQVWSLEQADRYYNLVIDEIECIASNPQLGRSMDHIREGYRSTKVKSHVIYYKYLDAGTILIVRILHQRMDYESRMK